MRLIGYTLCRTFRASPSRVFRAFTDPEDLAAWVWGEYSKDVRATLDLRPGGAFEITTDVSGRTGWGRERAGMRGLFVEVLPAAKLVHTLHWDAPVGYNAAGKDPVDEVISVTFEADPAGTRLSYTHLGIPDDGISAPEHERSVRSTFDLLERRLTACP